MQTLAGYLLVMLRITAWLVIAPPFSHKAIPAQVKALSGLGLTLAVGASMDFSTVSLETGPLVTAAVWQVFVGAALGFCCYLVFAAVEAAGSFIDLFGGFQLSSGYDPLMQSGAAVFGRLYQMTALVLLFASDGYLVLLHGLTSTFSVVGLDEGLSLRVVARVVSEGTGHLVVAALQIAGPLVAILFLTDVGLGLLTRAAPALQAFSLGFPLKIFITLAVSAMAVAMLPSLVDSFADDATRQTLLVSNASASADAAAAGAAGAPGRAAP
jgi:flagellar biosynthetic protein FliR